MSAEDLLTDSEIDSLNKFYNNGGTFEQLEEWLSNRITKKCDSCDYQSSDNQFNKEE